MRQALAHATRVAAQASGGRPVAVGSLHVTLVFLGSVPRCRLPELAETARVATAGVAGPASGTADSPGSALEIGFDRLEYWRAAHLLCALPAVAPDWVARLARRLQDALAGAGFAPDIKPFRPHVTLARKVDHPARTVEMQSVAWSFTDFVLVDSKALPERAVYTVLERFPFDPGS